MASSDPPNPRQPLYPQVLESNPDANPPSSSSSLYPSIDPNDLDKDLITAPINPTGPAPTAPPQEPAVQETLLSIPGSLLHLIDRHLSVELSSGEFSLHLLTQGPALIALLARVSNPHDPDSSVQWPLTRDTAAVKLDPAHYFFSLAVPGEDHSPKNPLLNYGLTFASAPQEALLSELDRLLETYCSFSVQKVNEKGKVEADDVLKVKQISVEEAMGEGPEKEMMEERSAAYWTTLAPNVDEYSGSVAKGIAKGSGKVVKGIIWCGDVTVERIKWGNELLKERMEPGEKSAEVSEETLKRIKRVKAVTEMSEKVAAGILTGVVRVSAIFASSFANSRVGKKIIGLIPGEILLASLDGFGKIFDAVEVAGKNVLSTSSDATTGLVSHRYGEEAAEATHESLHAAGHAIGTAWNVFKIRKAMDPKCILKPTTLTKSAIKAAAEEIKAKKEKGK